MQWSEKYKSELLSDLCCSVDYELFCDIARVENIDKNLACKAAFIFYGRSAAETALRINEVEARKLTRKEINDLPDSEFAYIEPGGKKDEEGKTVPRSLRHFPLVDAAHVRNALARLPQSKLPLEAKKKALRKIKQKAKKFGIKVTLEL